MERVPNFLNFVCRKNINDSTVRRATEADIYGSGGTLSVRDNNPMVLLDGEDGKKSF
jgi:hypothetical protein